MRIAVIDRSPLIGLTHLGLSSKLALYFDRIYVPRRVQTEVNRKLKFRYSLNKLYASGLFQKCACADEVNVRLLRLELGGGEAEAIVQAQEKAAAFVIADESRARESSVRRGLRPVGTARLLARLRREGYTENVWIMVRKLRKVNFHLAEAVVIEAIAMAELPIR